MYSTDLIKNIKNTAALDKLNYELKFKLLLQSNIKKLVQVPNNNKYIGAAILKEPGCGKHNVNNGLLCLLAKIR